MGDIVEKVARAIAAADQEDYIEDFQRYDKRARAAIEAFDALESDNERLRAALAICRDLRKWDAAVIARLRGALSMGKTDG